MVDHNFYFHANAIKQLQKYSLSTKPNKAKKIEHAHTVQIKSHYQLTEESSYVEYKM